VTKEEIIREIEEIDTKRNTVKGVSLSEDFQDELLDRRDELAEELDRILYREACERGNWREAWEIASKHTGTRKRCVKELEEWHLMESHAECMCRGWEF